LSSSHFLPAQEAQEATDGDVALRLELLELPILKGVDAGTLLKYRQDNWPHFKRFRAALRAAIQESLEKNGSEDPAKVSRTVMADYIKPEIAAIERDLRTARGTLGSKSAG